ncbi:MAG: hypothetical protein L3J17_15320 [Candidatus Jettenia sp.]|nr:MAG: hypothetical protein L3J17_15320 [Candidatus Jettenia sp.]
MNNTELKEFIPPVKQTYRKTSYSPRGFLSPIRLLYRLLQQFDRKFRVNAWVISGDESLKTSITTIFTGNKKNKNYLNNLLFNNFCSEIYIGKIWRWNSIKIVHKKPLGCSLRISEIHKNSRKLPGNKASFFIPCWVGGEADLSADISTIIHKKSLNSDLNKIKQGNMQFEITKEKSRFDNFYYTMYLPYITRVHKNRVIPLPYETMKKNLKRCDLLMIKKDSEFIAGQLIIYNNDMPRLWFTGLKNGNIDYLKDHITGAMYYFAMTYLKQKGYKRVHFGLTRPFLNDGVFQYKKKRSLQITDSSKIGFLIQPLTKSVNVKNFFLRNPFIYIDEDKLNGAVFIESDQLCSQEDLKKIYKNYYLKGLSKLNIYLFGDNERNTREIIPPELRERMSIQLF